MKEAIKSGDLSELERYLNNFEIVVGKSEENGFFTAYSTSEPLFCFERKTEGELQGLVVDTLKSYVETFYEAHQVKVRVVAEEAPPAIPVKRLLALSFLRPHFESFTRNIDGLAVA